MADIDFGQLAEALNDKMDRDVGNVASDGKERIAAFGMPCYANQISISSWPYTFPDNGWVSVSIAANNNQYGQYITYTSPDGSSFRCGHGEYSHGMYNNSQDTFFPVERGGVLSRSSSATSAIFFPMKYINAN